GRDTSLCRTDTFQLFANSKALSFSWTPSTYLNNPNLKAPVTRPDTSITYYVTANLGKCQDKDTINLKVTPYPKANAGRDTSICFQTSGQLNGIIVGSSFNWSPTSTLQNPNTLNPLAGPIRTTNYVLTAYDTLGCPKPFRDTVVVTVIPKVPAFAGRDTIIVVNQPLQLHATGGINYFWTPATGMSEPNVPNPVVKLGHNIDTIRYIVRVSTAEGCFATDDIVVRVFKTAPDLFIPSGFTPNSDGKNDVLRPTVVGMKSLAYFRVYNRWGQMMYSTSEIGKGWDGTFGGKKQTSGSYVYVAEATDYLDNKIVKKGTAVLIR
ncbi:MAG: cell surface protein, partial [Segetibacter sp.]|nr:cell surface protein [Segetibacter sp.]